MGDFLSILYTVVDTLSLIFFLDAFATRRWDNWKFKLGVGCFIALLCWVLLFQCLVIFSTGRQNDSTVQAHFFVLELFYILHVYQKGLLDSQESKSLQLF